MARRVPSASSGGQALRGVPRLPGREGGPAGAGRPTLLERYLAHLHAELAGKTVHRHMIGQLNLFFTAIRQHGWDSTLPTNAMFFREDLPKNPSGCPAR